DISITVHVIAEKARDVVGTFRKHCVMARRSAKTRFTGRDGRFADQSFALVKVTFLLADVHDDPRTSGNAVIVPPPCGSSARIEPRRPIRLWILFATANDQRREQGSGNSH